MKIITSNFFAATNSRNLATVFWDILLLVIIEKTLYDGKRMFLFNLAERKLKPDREDRGGGWLSDLSVCVYLKQGSLGSLCLPVSYR